MPGLATGTFQTIHSVSNNIYYASPTTFAQAKVLFTRRELGHD